MSLNEQRQRLLRILTGAILTNSATDSEVQEFCSIIASDRELTEDLYDTLQRLNFSQRTATPKNLSDKKDPTIDLVEQAYNTLQNNRISKRDALNAMLKFSPTFLTPSGVEKMATRDLLRKYNQHSPNSFIKLLNFISGYDADPYLSKIGRQR